MKVFRIILLVSLAASCSKESDSPGRFVETRPADKAVDVDVDNHVIIVFTESVADGTAVSQAESGACTGQPIEVSKDEFVNCLGGTVTIVPESDKHKLDWAPVAPLDVETTYKVRVNKMDFDEFKPLADAVTVSFTTSATASDGEREPSNK